MEPLVSIISIYYNREQYLTKSINSLINQTYSNIEIILVDDGSSDNTLRNMNEIQDERIKVYSHENIGFVKSINKAILKSKGKYIAIHGSGDISLSTRIEKQVKYLENNSDTGLVASYVQQETLDGLKNQVVKGRIKEIDFSKELIKKNSIVHGSAMFRRTIYNEVGGYREYFKYGQDLDLWLRMSMITKAYIIPEILYKMYILPGSVSEDISKTILQLYLRTMLIDSLQSKKTGEKDLIEKHDGYAPFFRKRNRDLSTQFARLSIIELSKGSLDKASYLAKLSKNEYRTIINTILEVCILFSEKSKTINFLLMSAVRQIRKNKVK